LAQSNTSAVVVRCDGLQTRPRATAKIITDQAAIGGRSDEVENKSENPDQPSNV
jgi:hypothetical protein